MVLTRSRASGKQAQSSGSELSDAKLPPQTRNTRPATRLSGGTKSPLVQPDADKFLHAAAHADKESAEPSRLPEQPVPPTCRVGSGSEADESSACATSEDEMSEQQPAFEELTEPVAAELVSSSYARRCPDLEPAGARQLHIEGVRTVSRFKGDNAAQATQGPVAMDTEDEEQDGESIAGPVSQLAASIRAALVAKASLSGDPILSAAHVEPVGVSIGVAGPEHSSHTSDADQESDPGGATEDPPSQLQWRPAISLPEQKFRRSAHATKIEAEKEKGLAKKLKDVVLAAPAEEKRDKWWQLPTTTITPDLKNELRLLHLRSAFDTKTFYKSFDHTKFPDRFQIGTIVEGPADFYGGRLTKRERKATMTEQLLADPDLTAMRKKRYAKIQEEATRFLKVKKRKTDQPRDKKRKPKPKH